MLLTRIYFTEFKLTRIYFTEFNHIICSKKNWSWYLFYQHLQQDWCSCSIWWFQTIWFWKGFRWDILLSVSII